MRQQPMDVWLKFALESDEEPTHEANTFLDADMFRIDWYHVDVGLVNSVRFSTYVEAVDWYESEGFLDFSS